MNDELETKDLMSLKLYLNYQLKDIRKEIDNNFNHLVKKQEIMAEKLQRQLLTLDDAIADHKLELLKVREELFLHGQRIKEESGVHLTQLVIMSKRIDKLEENTLNARRLLEIAHGLENYREYRTAIENLETDVMYLKEGSRKTPHKCSVCNGESKTQVMHATIEAFEKRIIDSQGRHFILCHACEGKGIVWG
jgi:hypothetical protein